MTITEAVARRLEALLHERKMKKSEFKSLSGINGQSINNIFRTKSTSSISMATLCKICNALGITMAEFLTDPLFDYVSLN